MELECKVNVDCFGYVNTKTSSTKLKAGKKYKLVKDYDDILHADYYKVILNDKEITTISVSEYETFFK